MTGLDVIEELKKHEYIKATRDVSHSKIFQSGAGTHRNPKYTKAARGRAALQKIQSGERLATLRKARTIQQSQSVAGMYCTSLLA